MPVTHGVAGSNPVQTAKGKLRFPFFYALYSRNQPFSNIFRKIRENEIKPLFHFSVTTGDRVMDTALPIGKRLPSFGLAEYKTVSGLKAVKRKRISFCEVYIAVTYLPVQILRNHN